MHVGIRAKFGFVGTSTVGPLAVGPIAVGLVVVGAMVGLVFTTPTPANAALSAGEIPVQETGVVTKVADGDTFMFLADGATQAVRVRLLGVNTPEVAGFNNAHFDRDFCGGRAASANLASWLPPGTRVQLKANSKESSNRGRILRYPFAYNPDTGQYDRDISSLVAASGLATWFTIDGESDLSYPYRLLVDEAARQGIGIWNPAYCGPVQQPKAQLDLSIVWNPPGADTSNLNGEYVVVRNVGTDPVDLSGWLLRDSSLTSWFYLPSGTILVPGDYFVAHVGSGTNGQPTPRDFYFGSSTPLFPNTSTTQFLGDGAYLYDRATALRAYEVYPCISDCTDPLRGRVVISKVNAKSTSSNPAVAANQEYVVVTNLTASPTPLDGYFLRRKVSTYPFPPQTMLPPRGSIRVRIGTGSSTATTQYWGQPSPLLTNKHDLVELVSSQDVVISRKQW